MPFSAEVKTQMFVRCARICCLCYKQCGTNIEAAHIVAEADGGPNVESNGIPLCMDCHTEISHYDPRQPKGNRFRREELVARRDQVYALVTSGALQARVVAAQAHARRLAPGVGDNLNEARPVASRDAQDLLARIHASTDPVPGLARKVGLLSEGDRAIVLDELLTTAREKVAAIRALGAIASNPTLARSDASVVVESMTRASTISDSVDAKAAWLDSVNDDALLLASEDVRVALFEDVLDIVARDDFDEVNVIVRPLVERVRALPKELHGQYVMTLLDQSTSRARRGAPAARQGLRDLPDEVAAAGLGKIDSMYLRSIGKADAARPVLQQYVHLLSGPQRAVIEDFLRLSLRQFYEKYPWEED